MATSINSKAKPDTILLLDFAAGNDWIDYSQNRTDLTDGTTYLYETNSARTALEAPRTIEVQLDVQTGEAGVLVELGDGTIIDNASYRIEISGGTVYCYEYGAARVSAAIPGLTASDRKITIAWAQFVDGTDVRSELTIYNHSTAVFEVAQATHAASTPDSSHTFAVGADSAGGNAFAGGLDFYYVRIGKRFHSGVEVREDWVSTTSAPTTTQTLRRAPLVPDRANVGAIAADGSLAGPEWLWSGHVFERCDRRLVGSILNLRTMDPIAVDYGYDMASTAWWSYAPGDSTLRTCLAFLWRRPVPLKCNRANVRVHVGMNNTTATTTVATLTMRVYSMAGLPAYGDVEPEPLRYHRTSAGTRATDDGAALYQGAWVDLGALDLAVDSSGCTWLALAVKFDEGHAQIANTEAYVHAITVDPYHEPTEAGGIGFEFP